jgi:hypothetical protein
MASLTTTPSRVLRSPTAYPFAFFFAFGLAVALAALAGLAAFALAGLAFRGALRSGALVTVAVGAACRRHRGRRAAALADDRVGPGQVAARDADARGVLGHAHRELEAEVEDLLRELAYLLRHLVLGQLTPLGGLHSIYWVGAP